jgi:hypothetical protein
MWKTRTRTKIMTIALLLIAIWVSVVVIAWAVKGQPGAPEMVIALLSTGGVSFCTFLWTIMTENKHLKGTKGNERHEA